MNEDPPHLCSEADFFIYIYRMRYTTILLILALGACFTACDSVNGPSMSVPATKSPKTGTLFTYNYVLFNEFGKPEFTFETTDSVVERFTFAGKETVIVLARPGFPPSESDTHLAYEFNGDISEYYNSLGDMPSMWVTYPVQSLAAHTYTLIDTSGYLDGPEYAHGVVTMDVTFEGYTTMKIDTTTLVLVNIKAAMKAELTSATRHEIQRSDKHYSFAPELGCIAKEYTIDEGSVSRYEKTLIGFTLAD